jgi:hypothetical protein
LVEPTERRLVAVEENGRALVEAQRVRRADIAASGVPGHATLYPLGRSGCVSSHPRALLATALLFSPILAAIIRKYVFWSDAVFLLHYAGLITLLGLLLLRNGAYRLVPQNVFTVACLLVGWTCVQGALTGVPPLALAVGTSTYLIPVLALYVSIVAFATTPRLLIYSFWMATTIQIVSYGFGILQINSDPGSVFNYMPPGVEIPVAGYATTDGLDLGIEYIVRPVSIYMHTGQFGSVVFVLSLFRVFYMYLASYSSTHIVLQVLAVDLPALIISGQRAAGLVYLPTLLIVLLRRGGSISWITLWGGIALVYLGWAAGLLPTSLLSFGDVGAERIASGLGEISARLEANLLKPAAALLERYFLIGEGPGMFSAGLRNLADPGNADQFTFSDTENGWLRTAAELGIFGMLLYGLMLWTLAAVGIRLSRRFFNYLTLLCLGVALWSNTHDLFNNYVMMWQGFLLAGIVLLNDGSPVERGKWMLPVAST